MCQYAWGYSHDFPHALDSCRMVGGNGACENGNAAGAFFGKALIDRADLPSVVTTRRYIRNRSICLIDG